MSILEQTSQSFSIQNKLSNLNIGDEVKTLLDNTVHENKSLNVQDLSSEERSDDDIFWIKPTQMTFEQVVIDKGFDFSEHEVRTEDGYLLKLFRIRDKTIVGKEAPAVFMQHGFLASATTFIKYADDNTPVFNMAREGYDVWVGNNRGNQYTHTNNKIDWKTDPKAFHDFSFPDLGKYDLPVQIDLALTTSGQEKLTYVAHSQGTSQMFWALANDQDHYLSRVNAFVALAPVANMAHVEYDVKMATHTMGTAKYIAEYDEIWSLFNPEEMDLTNLGEAGEVLLNFVNFFAGKFLGHEADPKESSTKEAWHFGQIVKNGGIFAEYSNINGPGKRIPLENITKMPIWLFVGSKDPLATYQDNLTNQKELGNVKKLTLINGFNHHDYLLPKHVNFQKTLVATVNEINGKTKVEETLF